MDNRAERNQRATRAAVSRESQSRLQARLEESSTPHEATLLTLFIYIEGAGRHADALQNRIVQKWNLDSAQVSILFALWCAPPPHRQSPTVLHRQLIQSPSGMTHTLRRLTDAGLTRRIRDPQDGRSWHVELTPTGVEVIQSATDELKSHLVNLFNGITAAQLDRLADAQRTIIEVLATSTLAYPLSSRPAAEHASPSR
jgi:MarR family multiple antibiotic resistance transcriptional regulator